MLLLTREFLSDNVHYVVQPQYTPDGTITGAELLARLNDSCYLKLPELIRLATIYGMSHVFDCFTIDAAIRILPIFLKLNSRFNLSINICPQSVNIEPYLSDYIAQKLTDAEIDGGSFTVELTEHMRESQTDKLVCFIDGVHAAGCRVVLDDYLMKGSKWHHLYQLPVDGIKLDRSYIAMLDESPKGEILVSGVVNTAQRLGKSITAEGVELPRQLRKVQKMGISSIQGYLRYKPMSFESLVELLLWQERQRATLSVAA